MSRVQVGQWPKILAGQKPDDKTCALIRRLNVIMEYEGSTFDPDDLRPDERQVPPRFAGLAWTRRAIRQHRHRKTHSSVYVLEEDPASSDDGRLEEDGTDTAAPGTK